MDVRHPAAVLFDMDGTLVDSEKVWDVALDELAAHCGGQLSRAAREAMVGSSMDRSITLLHADLGLPGRDPDADARWLEERVLQLFATGLPWRPGAAALLAAVRAAGVPTALVTSTSRRLVEAALETLGRDNFDVVVCGDEVHATKPDPAPYLIAADLLGVPIGQCVAVEDSPTGVASAVAAGAAVLAVPCDVELRRRDGVTLRSSLAAVDLAVLSGLLTGGQAYA